VSAYQEEQALSAKPRKITWNWEQIDPYHQRCRVIGGWLVKAYEGVHQAIYAENGYDNVAGFDYRVAMAFVPDPAYEWEIEVEE